MRGICLKLDVEGQGVWEKFGRRWTGRMGVFKSCCLEPRRNNANFMSGAINFIKIGIFDAYRNRN